MKKIIKTFALTLVVLLVFRTFFADVYLIPSVSMQPTLKIGDLVLVNKLAFGAWVFNWHLTGYAEPQKGQMLAFFMPAEGKKKTDAKTKFVKRCTGVPGDKMSASTKGWAITTNSPIAGFAIPAKGDTVQLNVFNIGFYKPLIEQYELQKAAQIGGQIYINAKVADLFVFSQNYYFVEGDNATESHDSRYWGLLPANHLIGKIAYVF